MSSRLVLGFVGVVVSFGVLASNGYTPKPAQPTAPVEGKTRAQVLAELAEWNRNPVTADGYRWVGGDAGWVYVGVPNAPQKTRAEVLRELREWERNPVTADGFRWVGGDAGWVYVGVAPSGK